MVNSGQEITGPINLGNPFEYKIIDLAKLIIEKTNSKSKILHKNLPDDDPMQRRPNINMAKKHLDSWEPSVKLEIGLDRTIDYFKTKI